MPTLTQVIDDDDQLQPYLLKLAQHFAGMNDLPRAEKFYVKGGMYNEAITMYNQAGTFFRVQVIPVERKECVPL